MIAIQSPTHAQPTAAKRRPASPTFFDLLDELAFGVDGLESAADETFRDTIPAVCWAVPGAYAGAIEG